MANVLLNLDSLVDEIVSNNVNVVAANEAVTTAGNSAVEAEASAVDASEYADEAYDSSVIAVAKAAEASTSAGVAAAKVVEAQGKVDLAVAAKDEAEQAAAEAYAHRVQALEYLTQMGVKYDEFDDRYLGAHAGEPTTDNDGFAIQEGAMVWDTTVQALKLWNGVGWNSIAESSGSLLAEYNLSDLINKTTARTNLNVYSKEEVNTKVSDAIDAVVAGSQSTLDTLSELAEAIGNDPDFVNTITTSISTKVSKAGDVMTGNLTVPNLVVTGNVDGRDISVDGAKLDTIESGATGDQTAAEIEVLYEGLANTNKYTDAEKTLVGVATVMTTDAITLTGAVNELDGHVDTHIAATGAHGVGTVVGTSEVQTLTNKVIDDLTNWIGANHVHYKVKATENMVAGTVVMGVGYNSGEDAFEVVKWTVASGKPALGMLQETLVSGAMGMLVQSGQVKDINTSALTVDTVYYPADGGLLTATKPSGAYQAAVYVLRSHSSQGAVTVSFTEPVDKRASSVSVVASGNLVATNVQNALVELQGDIDTIDGTLDGVVADLNAVHIDRADKYLAAQAVANMVYTDGKLTKVQYNNATDVEREVLAYDGTGKLVTVQHYTASTLRGTTTLSYTDGKLVSAIYVGV